jgi:hypothetical protein
MSGIVMGWDAILPVILELRLLAFIVGFALIVHSYCMAGFMHQKSTWTATALVAANAGASMFLILGAIIGSPSFLLVASLATCASLTTMALWLWYHGMHVSEFLLQHD